MKSLNHSSTVSLERVRTSWRQPCCYATCLNPQTPKRDTFETRCKDSSTWWQLSKQRAQPLDTEGQPQKSTPSQLETRGRCLFTKNHHLEARRRCQSRNASSTIESLTTLDTTSTSIDAANMMTLRNEASRWALESSAGQFRACHYRARPTPDQHRQIQRRNQARAMAGGFSAGMPPGRRPRGRSSHHSAASAFPLRHCSRVARGTPGQPNPRLGRSGPGVRGKLQGDLHLPRQFMGP